MIGIVDADLIGRKRHRFPNLALEKIAGFFKEREEVRLITDYDEIRSNRNEKEERLKLQAELVKIQESVKSAHHRIDRIEGELK